MVMALKKQKTEDTAYATTHIGVGAGPLPCRSTRSRASREGDLLYFALCAETPFYVIRLTLAYFARVPAVRPGKKDKAQP